MQCKKKYTYKLVVHYEHKLVNPNKSLVNKREMQAAYSDQGVALRCGGEAPSVLSAMQEEVYVYGSS